MVMTGLAGLHKGRMGLMQSYGTVCKESLAILALRRLSENGG